MAGLWTRSTRVSVALRRSASRSAKPPASPRPFSRRFSHVSDCVAPSAAARGATPASPRAQSRASSHVRPADAATSVPSAAPPAARSSLPQSVNVSRAAPGEESSALPALGLGQWAKLQLWKLPADRVLYLDADVVVLRNIDELFAALERRGGPPAPLAAVDDYFSGGVLFLAPNAAEETAFADTLAQDSGRYVYGEQDFLNVHFGGAHARLSSEYKCLAKDVPENRSALASICAVLEFSSCPTRWGGAWKPWHGMAMLADPDFKICTFRPTGDFENLVDVWRGFHERALADLAARGLPPLSDPEPYSHAVAQA